MNAAVAGNPLTLVKIRRGYNSQSGRYTEKTWEGMRDQVEGCIADLEAGGVATYDIEQADSAKYVLKARWADDQSGGEQTEIPVDEVRVHYQPATKTFYNSPAFSHVTKADIRRIRIFLQDPIPDSEPALTGDPDDSLALEQAIDLFALLESLGDSGYIVSMPVLSRTRVASNKYDFRGVTRTAQQNVGAILSSGTLVDDADIPNILVSLPQSAGRYQITGRIYVVKGWLKHPYEFTQAAGSKAMFSQEYQFGVWPTAIYGPLL